MDASRIRPGACSVRTKNSVNASPCGVHRSPSSSAFSKLRQDTCPTPAATRSSNRTTSRWLSASGAAHARFQASFARVPRAQCRAAASSGDVEPAPEASTSGLDEPSYSPVQTGSGSSDFKWGSYISDKPELGAAVNEAVLEILDSIGYDAEPELAVVFISSTFGPQFNEVVPLLKNRVPSLKNIIGCSGYGVIGGGGRREAREVEGSPGFSLSLGCLPGVKVKLRHTLRSSIPDEDASPEEWASFVGVPHDSPKNTSFIIMSDPRFSQLTSILQGLDYAFPDSPKIGGIMSTSDRSKSRTMFAWSAESGEPTQKKSEMAKVKGRRMSSYLARRRRSGGVLSTVDGASTKGKDVNLSTSSNGNEAKPPTASESSSSSQAEEQAGSQMLGAGFLGRIANWFSNLSSSEPRGSVDDKQAPSGGEPPSNDLGLSKVSSSERLDSGDASTTSDVPAAVPNGMYMYGAVVMTLQGDVMLDTITSRGYRCPSGSLFRMERVIDNHIVSILPVLDESGNSIASSNRPSDDGNLLRRDNDDSDDDIEDEDGESDFSGEEYLAAAAIADMMEALGPTYNMGEIVETTVLAVVSDSSKAVDELTPNDFDLCEIMEVDAESMLSVDGEVRKGYRFKVMVRDKQGMQEDLRDKVLEYKRKDLQAMMMGGQDLPTTLGLLMFSDLGRGVDLHEEPHFESNLLKTYLPVPISGFFGGGQIAVVKETSTVLEQSSVVGILRAIPSKKNRSEKQ